jgi:predicted lipid-binding transport protein (Tim44 family)
MRGQDHRMSTFRERAATYVGRRAPQQAMKPRIRPFIVAGAFWGALMGVLMPLLTGGGLSGWLFVFWLVYGIVGFAPLMYWLASRKWRSAGG